MLSTAILEGSYNDNAELTPPKEGAHPGVALMAGCDFLRAPGLARCTCPG